MAEEKKVVAEPAPEAAPVEEAPKKEKKAAKKAPKEEKKAPAKPAKPMPTEARATALNVRVTPRKCRLVLDLVRGKDVKVALGILANVNKSAAEPVSKVIRSAAANAVNNFGMDQDSLYIASIWANDGMRIKRYLPRAKGSASGLVKRSAHLTCVVKMR